MERGEAVNTAKLKGKIAECGLSQRKCAAAIGISITAMYQKINEIDGRCFNVDEAQKLCSVLNLTGAEAAEIFLH